MTKQEIISGYMAAERPYSVCLHTHMGGYMEFATVESGIMFEDNARMVCDQYAETMRKSPSDTFIGVCVRRDGVTIFEVKLTK